MLDGCSNTCKAKNATDKGNYTAAHVNMVRFPSPLAIGGHIDVTLEVTFVSVGESG